MAAQRAREIRGTREWAVAEINCCTGCPHDCRYCYARAAALRRGTIDSAGQWRRTEIVAAAVQREHGRYPGQVMFPASHDIVPENLDACIAVLDRLLAAGNRVLVVSKPTPACIERLCACFRDRREQLLFRFTITARNPALLAFWEPAAPSYRERRQALALAARRGFATSVSIEPMLEMADVAALVGELAPDVTHSVWLGAMNKIAERVLVDSTAVREEVARIEREQTAPRLRELYRALKNNPLVRWKESIKQVVGLPLAEQPGLDR